jgi:hypothetical protein
VYIGHAWDSQKSGCCSKVAVFYGFSFKIAINFWLLTGGHCSDVAINTGWTVSNMIFVSIILFLF